MLLNFMILRNFFIASFIGIFTVSCGQPDQEWNSYGMDLSNQRFSRVTQINKTNVETLEIVFLT